MEKYYDILLGCVLFNGFTHGDLDMLINCFSPTVHTFKKGEAIVMQGYENRYICVVLSGMAQGARTSHSGDETIISNFSKGEVFGDVLSGSHEKSPITVTAKTDCSIIQLDYKKIVSPCIQGHSCHSLLLQNLVASISDKYFRISKRNEILCKKNLRAKISAFLLDSYKNTKCLAFNLPFNRTELASYLNCNRTALCRELQHMVLEELISINKNSFTIKSLDELQKTAF